MAQQERMDEIEESVRRLEAHRLPPADMERIVNQMIDQMRSFLDDAMEEIITREFAARMSERLLDLID